MDNSEDNKKNSKLLLAAAELRMAIKEYMESQCIESITAFLESLNLGIGIESAKSRLSSTFAGGKLPDNYLAAIVNISKVHKFLKLEIAAANYVKIFNEVQLELSGRPTKEILEVIRSTLSEKYDLANIKNYIQLYNDPELLRPIIAALASVSTLKLSSDHPPDDLEWLIGFQRSVLLKLGDIETVFFKRTSSQSENPIVNTVISDRSLLHDLDFYLNSFVLQWGRSKNIIYIDLVDPYNDSYNPRFELSV